MSEHLQIFVESNDKSVIDGLSPFIISRSEHHGLDGIDLLYGVIIALGPSTVEAISDIICEYIRAKKHVNVIHDGIEQPKTEKELKRALEKLTSKNEKYL